MYKLYNIFQNDLEIKILAISLENEKNFLFKCDPCQM